MGPVLPRIACVVFALAVLPSPASPRRASVRSGSQLGSSSATGNGVSQTPAPRPSSTVGRGRLGNGRPVVAYTEYPGRQRRQGAITVKRWTGTAWELLERRRPASARATSRRCASPRAGPSTSRGSRTTSTATPRSACACARRPPSTQLGGSDSPGGISGINAGITAPFSLGARTPPATRSWPSSASPTAASSSRPDAGHRRRHRAGVRAAMDGQRVGVRRLRLHAAAAPATR